MTSKEYGQRIRKLRTDRGMTQEVFGGLCGMSRQLVARIENGRNNPTLDSIVTILTGVGVSLEDFFEDVRPEPPDESEEYLSVIRLAESLPQSAKTSIVEIMRHLEKHQ